MTDKCGAETTQGHPCQNPADSCPWHDGDAPDTGRKSLLEKNPDLVDRVSDRLAAGDTVAEACAEVDGITERLYYEWRARAEEDGGVFKQFLQETTRARKGAGRKDRAELEQAIRESMDTRTWYKLHMKQYGDQYGDEDADMREESQIILHDESESYLNAIER